MSACASVDEDSLSSPTSGYARSVVESRFSRGKWRGCWGAAPCRISRRVAALELSLSSRRFMLQNRVDPWGRLYSVDDRGSLMGSRGMLYNEERTVVRTWAHKNWVTCRLSFKEIKRPPPFSTSNHYSELFFLDEATGLAVGTDQRRDAG